MLEASPTQIHASGTYSEHAWTSTKSRAPCPQPHSITQVNACRLFQQYFQWININFSYILEVFHGSVPKQKVEECSIICASVTNGVWHDQQELALNSPALCTLTDFHDCSLKHEISLKYDCSSANSVHVSQYFLYNSLKRVRNCALFMLVKEVTHTCNFYK